MSSIRPDQLSGVSGLSDSDILIAEVNPDNAARQVVKISRLDLLSGVSGSDTSASNIGPGSGLVSGVTSNDIKIKSLVAGTNVSINGDADTLTINSSGSSNTTSTSSFCFFSNAVNNDGIIEKTYYLTPTTSTYLSGINVDSADDITLYLRWDGPTDSYMGTGYINGQQIPTGNVTELGNHTRRFEGYISGLDLAGATIATGSANGFTGTISVTEAGGGPTPLHVTIADVSTATPKPGENLGSTDLKGGDTIDIFATFSTNDVTGIKVYDSGISDGIPYASYSLTDTGDGNHTATIPVTINSSRVGPQGVSIVAQNNFGTAGDDTASSNNVPLNQTYPSITASDPSSYPNGQGLSSGESTTFVNSIANWDSTNGDTVLYSGLTSDISITASGTFQNPKTVTYVTGIYNNSDNLRISASRDDNGATDSTDITIKIAKPPVITGIVLPPTANSATSPNIVGLTEIKGGDIVNTEVYVNGNGVTAGNIRLYVKDEGVSDGTQDNYSSYSSSTLGDGSFKYTVPVNVTSLTARDGARSVVLKPRNNYDTVGTEFSSSASATVNNTDFPTVSIGSISYPSNQSALKDSESATVSNSVSNFDSLVYSSPTSELTITNDTTYEASKNVSRSDGAYNITTDNFTITATRLPNGMVRDDSAVVNIAHTGAVFTINNLASSIAVNTGSAVTDNFDLDIDQVLYEIPSLAIDPSQSPASTLTATASGTNPTSNNYRINVLASDQKGVFTFAVSGRNLAGRETASIGVNPNYTISGIEKFTGLANATSPCAGLIPLNTAVLDPSTLSVENISEAGGGGPNNGTMYAYKYYADGTTIDCTFDENNEFAVVTSGATLLANQTGNFIFNLELNNRNANGDPANPAQFVIEQP